MLNRSFIAALLASRPPRPRHPDRRIRLGRRPGHHPRRLRQSRRCKQRHRRADRQHQQWQLRCPGCPQWRSLSPRCRGTALRHARPIWRWLVASSAATSSRRASSVTTSAPAAARRCASGLQLRRQRRYRQLPGSAGGNDPLHRRLGLERSGSSMDLRQCRRRCLGDRGSSVQQPGHRCHGAAVWIDSLRVSVWFYHPFYRYSRRNLRSLRGYRRCCPPAL